MTPDIETPNIEIPSFETRHATLRYGRVTAVDDLSVAIEGPGIYGLLGRNGSGKSSLLSLVAGYRRPSGGEVLVGGAPVFENPAAASQVCLIRESADTVEHDWPDNKVDHALGFAAANRPHWDADYAGSLVERFRLPGRAAVASLSRGQRCALAVTLGLASRAPVTIFDESYLGMDAPSRYVFYDEVLAEFMARPRLFVISTHLIEEVSPLLEEVVLIDGGRLLLHENKDVLQERGATVIGPAEQVDRFVDGLEVLSDRTLGPTRSVAVFGPLDDGRAEAARQAGLELGPLPLQDLFVHLTDPSRLVPTGGTR